MKRPLTAPKGVVDISSLSLPNKITAAQVIVNTAASSSVLKASKPIQQAQQTLATATDTALDAVNAHAAAKKAMAQAETQLLSSETGLINAANAYRDTVNLTPNIDPPTIMALGLKVAGARGSVKAMTPPVGVVAKIGAGQGEVTVRWKRIPSAKTYVVQTTQDPAAQTGWTETAIVTKSKVVLTGLPSGKRTWIRVASVGAAGTSAYGAPIGASVA
jgi:hypothetical protein